MVEIIKYSETNKDELIERSISLLMFRLMSQQLLMKSSEKATLLFTASAAYMIRQNFHRLK